jgi:hypothetical protein
MQIEIETNTMKNLFFAAISALPFFIATLDPTDFRAIVFTAVLSTFLTAFGKLCDFVIKYLLIRFFKGNDRTTSDN